MTELLALQSAEISNITVKTVKAGNKTWSLGSEYLNRVAESAFTYTDSAEAIVDALKTAYIDGHMSVKEIQEAYLTGAIVKYLRRQNTNGDGEITQDYITQAELLLGKKNLTKLVTKPTDEHRTQQEQNYYQAANMAFSRLKEKAGLPKDERGAHNRNNGNATKGAEGLSLKDLKLDKVETTLDGMKALDMVAALISKLEKEKANAFSNDILEVMKEFRTKVATFHNKKELT